jgi:5-methylcytosine-specific restriction endonuclease McrA
VPRTGWTEEARKYEPLYRTAEYKTNRAHVLTLAIGNWCPFFGIDPRCPGMMHAGQRLSCDHRIPVSRGGGNDLGNLRGAHADCNRRAGQRAGGKVSNDRQGRGKGSRGGQAKPKPWTHGSLSRNSRVW